MQGRRPGRDSEGVLDLAGARELGLELGHLRAHRERAALQHARHLVQLGCPDVGPA